MDRREEQLTEQMPSEFDTPVVADRDANVVPLGRAPAVPRDIEEIRAQPRVHRIAIGGMATFALVGILAMLAFITVTWPGRAGRVVIGVFIFCGVAFLACAFTAVVTAARATYAAPSDAKDRSTG